MFVRGLLSKLAIITILSQALGAITNGLLIALLARKLNDNDFTIYVATVSLITVFGSFTLGIKTTTSREYALSKTHLTSIADISTPLVMLITIFVVAWIASFQVLESYLQIPSIYLLIAASILAASVLGSYATGMLQGLQKFVFWQSLVLITTIIQIPLILFPIGKRLGVGYFLAILAVPSVLLFGCAVIAARKSLTNPSQNFIRLSINEGLSLGAVTLMLQGPVFSSRLMDDSKVSVSTASLGLLFLALCGLSSTLGSYLLPAHVLKDRQEFNRDMLKPHVIHTIPLLLAGLFLLISKQNPLNIIFSDKYSFDMPKLLMGLITVCYALWSIGQSLLHSCITSLKSSLPYLLISLALAETCLLYVSRNNMYLFYSSFGIAGLLFLICVLYSFKEIPKDA
jgi:O-antigen/teichoic acid export membrane protein